MIALPVPPNEPERLKALEDYHILDTIDEADFDRLTQLAAIICDVPISLVSLVDEKRQWFKSNHGLGVKQTPRELAFCQYAIMNPSVFEVKDATKDDRFRASPLVADPAFGVRFYAGSALVTSDDQVCLCIN